MFWWTLFKIEINILILFLLILLVALLLKICAYTINEIPLILFRKYCRIVRMPYDMKMFRTSMDKACQSNYHLDCLARLAVGFERQMHSDALRLQKENAQQQEAQPKLKIYIPPPKVKVATLYYKRKSIQSLENCFKARKAQAVKLVDAATSSDLDINDSPPTEADIINQIRTERGYLEYMEAHLIREAVKISEAIFADTIQLESLRARRDELLQQLRH